MLYKKDHYLFVSKLILQNFNYTQVEFLIVLHVEPISIIASCLLVLILLQLEKIIGLCKILGELHGDKQDTFGLNKLLAMVFVV